jgi:pimeloyl-ACP methyl ester carboxylesterase
MQVVTQSLMTQYLRGGKGKVVVLLHGWGDSSAGLRSVYDYLSKNYDVITLDLPGFGATQAPPQAWGLDDYVAFVRDFLQKLGIKEVYAFVGHSNGGALAIRGLGNGTLQAEKLALLASAGIRNEYKGRNKALRILAKTGKLVTAPLPKAVQNKLRRKAYQTIGSDMLVAEHLQETFKRVVTDDVRADAAQLIMPVLLIYGEQDEATPVWYGEQYHELMNESTLEILPGAGHFVHLDRPRDVQKALTEFLS